jgi:hypothetical protein
MLEGWHPFWVVGALVTGAAVLFAIYQLVDFRGHRRERRDARREARQDDRQERREERRE